jgi:hypothetical protein
MAYWLLTFGMFGACTVLAVVILAARDLRQHKLRQEQKPLEERIAEIRESAAMMTHELQRVLDQGSAQQPTAIALIAPVLVYYRRLEALAAAPATTAEEIHQLAVEALQHMRQRRLKGFLVVQQAEQLADLVRRRNAA